MNRTTTGFLCMAFLLAVGLSAFSSEPTAEDLRFFGKGGQSVEIDYGLAAEDTLRIGVRV